MQSNRKLKIGFLKPDTIISRDDYHDPKVSVRLSNGEVLLHKEVLKNIADVTFHTEPMEDNESDDILDVYTANEFENLGYDVLIMLCGISRFERDVYHRSYKAFSEFKGRKMYILTDFRKECHINDYMLNLYKCDIASVELIVQAPNLNPRLIETLDGVFIKSIKHLPLHAIPFARSQFNVPSVKRKDICYTSQDFNLNGEYRTNKIKEAIGLLKNNSTCIHLIGKNSESFEDAKGLPPVNYENMIHILGLYKLNLSISEDVYEEHGLLPNRIFESIFAGSIPVIMGSETYYNEIKKSINRNNSNFINIILNLFIQSESDFHNLLNLDMDGYDIIIDDLRNVAYDEYSNFQNQYFKLLNCKNN